MTTNELNNKDLYASTDPKHGDNTDNLYNKNNSISVKSQVRVLTKKIPVYANNRIVGNVIKDVYLKRVFSSQHFLRKPPAISINNSEIIQIQQLGVKTILVYDKDDKKIYSTSLEYFMYKGCTTDRGWGIQTYLPLKEWIIDGKNKDDNYYKQILLGL